MKKFIVLFISLAFVSTACAETYIKKTPSAYTYKAIYDDIYLQSESDTLESVTDRGASTGNVLEVGGLGTSGTMSGNTASFNSVNVAGSYSLPQNTPNTGQTVIFQTGGATLWQTPATGGGYDTIQDEGGALAQRTTINFTGAGVTASDAGGITVVTIPETTLTDTLDSVTDRGASTTNILEVGGLGTSGTVSANTVSSNTVLATNYTSTVAIGTQPYAATSTTLNTNLNADLLDGLDSTDLTPTSFGITIDGGGSVITTGLKGFREIPFDFKITGWTILADQSGSTVIDVWKDTYANFPPTVADTIAGSEKPTLTAVQKNQDLSLSTWTTDVTSGDILAFNVDSAATVTWVTVIIRGTKQ